MICHFVATLLIASPVYAATGDGESIIFPLMICISLILLLFIVCFTQHKETQEKMSPKTQEKTPQELSAEEKKQEELAQREEYRKYLEKIIQTILLIRKIPRTPEELAKEDPNIIIMREAIIYCQEHLEELERQKQRKESEASYTSYQVLYQDDVADYGKIEPEPTSSQQGEVLYQGSGEDSTYEPQVSQHGETLYQDALEDYSKSEPEQETSSQGETLYQDDISSVSETEKQPQPTYSESKTLTELKEAVAKAQENKITCGDFILKKLAETGMTEPECYNAVFMDRKYFEKVKNNKIARPTKSSIYKLAIGLRLNFDETKELLKTVDYCYNDSDALDVIIKYFIDRKVYDIFVIQAALHEFRKMML